jgi:hypothetical protein
MHRCLGHPSKEVMQQALQNTRGFPKVDFPRCKPIFPGCAQGKMPQKVFLPSSSRASAPFDKIHSDLKQFPIESYHRHKYFISFVDDYSGYSWIMLLRQKSSAIIALKNFLVLIQTQYGHTIKRMDVRCWRRIQKQCFYKCPKGKGN